MRGDLPGHREKTDPDHDAFGVEGLHPENDPVKDQAYGHGHRTASDQFMSLRICHGTPPIHTGCEPNQSYGSGVLIFTTLF